MKRRCILLTILMVVVVMLGSCASLKTYDCEWIDVSYLSKDYYGTTKSVTDHYSCSSREAPVYEYISEAGEKVYSDGDYSRVHVYADSTATDYTDYMKGDLVGYVMIEKRCYVNQSKNAVELVTTIAKSEEKGNDRAYRCAKKRYFLNDSSGSYRNNFYLNEEVVGNTERIFYGEGVHFSFKVRDSEIIYK